MLDWLKDTQRFHLPTDWMLYQKLWQAVVPRNDQANLQPTLNKVARGASLTISLFLWLIVDIFQVNLDDTRDIAMNGYYN